MASILKVDAITGQSDTTEINSPITLSGNTATIGSGVTIPAAGITGTLGSSVVVPASLGASNVLLATYTADDSVATTYFNLGSYTSYDTYLIRFENLKMTTDGSSSVLRVSTTTTAAATGYFILAIRYFAHGSTSGVSYGHYNSTQLLNITMYQGTAAGEPGVWLSLIHI